MPNAAENAKLQKSRAKNESLLDVEEPPAKQRPHEEEVRIHEILLELGGHEQQPEKARQIHKKWDLHDEERHREHQERHVRVVRVEDLQAEQDPQTHEGHEEPTLSHIA